MAYGILGSQARPAIPELAQLMNNPAFPIASQNAFIALANIGKDALPVLTTFLTNTNGTKRGNLATYFGTVPALATNAESVVPLLRCLDDPDAEVSSSAALALGLMTRDFPSQANVVAVALSNSPPTLRITMASIYLLKCA